MIIMIDLWLTLYGDQATALENPDFLLNDFQAGHNTQVRLSRMAFDEAWQQLLNYALHGGGPHLSMIGSIWTSTLASMNVLRPFTASEINSMGGAGTFFAPAWTSAVVTEDSVWSIPFNLFTYLVLYRKDHLAKARVAEESAFASAPAFLETVRRMKAARLPSPITLPCGDPFRARTHLLASWIWGEGGNFISEDEKRICLTEPEAVRGMTQFFELYRLQISSDHGFNASNSLERFSRGETSIVISSAGAQQTIMQHNNRAVIENVGVAPLPGVPWLGGSTLVAWREVRMNLEQERAAVDLVKFLASPASQVKLANAQNGIPVRVESLPQLAYSVPAFRAAVEQSVRTGRTYPPVRLWVRIMNDLRNVFDLIAAEVIENQDTEVEQIIRRRLKPLETRLNLMLS
jgi:multiple sugar transport system substrate-binding protein